MALIKCPECEKEISDKAQACIHCGYPLVNSSEQAHSESFYKLTLVSYPSDKKIEVIKGLRLIFEYGLAHAKLASEELPHLLAEGLYLGECKKLKTSLERYFAVVEISPDHEAREHNEFFINSMYVRGKCFAKKPQCPFCRSTDVVVKTKSETIFSVLFKPAKTILVCKSCGKRF